MTGQVLGLGLVGHGLGLVGHGLHSITVKYSCLVGYCRKIVEICLRLLKLSNIQKQTNCITTFKRKRGQSCSINVSY